MKTALLAVLCCGLAMAAAALPARAEPAAVTSTDVRFRGASDQVSLAGTFSLPRAAGAKLPAVLLIHGTGFVDRDETIANHKPFRSIAGYLNAAGYAVLRYDKRGAGLSTGPVATLTLDDLAADAEAAFDWLRKQPGIDPQRVGLLGHSEGGLVAPMIAARRPEVAWLVLLGAPTVPGRELVLYQTAQGVRDRGRSEAEVQSAMTSARHLFEIVLRDQPAEARAAELDAALEAERAARNLPPRFVSDQKRGMLNPWFRKMLAYDPLPVLKTVQQPVLMLYGALDHQVPPALNVEPARAALHGHAHSEVEVLPGLDHLFLAAKTGAVSEYATLPGGFETVALDRIKTWLDTNAKH